MYKPDDKRNIDWLTTLTLYFALVNVQALKCVVQGILVHVLKEFGP